MRERFVELLGRRVEPLEDPFQLQPLRVGICLLISVLLFSGFSRGTIEREAAGVACV
jgi:hypothetical protein